MTKEEIKETEKKIKEFTKTLDSYSNEELVHFYKIALGRDTEQRGLYSSLIKEIDKIRTKKGWIGEISNRAVGIEKVSTKINYKK